MIRKLKLVVILLVPILLLGGGSYAIWSGTVTASSLPVKLPFIPTPTPTEAQALKAAKKKAEEPGITLSTKERVVTLADTQALRYLKTEVVLEFETGKEETVPTGEAYKKAQEELGKELTPVLPAIEDTITRALTSRTSSEMASPDGKDKLKVELLGKINQLPLERHVKNIYFTQFIIQ